MNIIIEESFGGFINKELNCYDGMNTNNELEEQYYEGSRNRGSDQFIDFKVSGFENGQKLISEAEFVDQNQTEDCSKSSCSEKYIKGLEGLREEISSEVHKLSLSMSIDEGKQIFLEKLESFVEIISMRYSSSLDEDLSFKKYKLEDINDRYIELEPHLHPSIDEFVKGSQVEDLHEHQCVHNKGTETMDDLANSEEHSLKKRSWDWESDEDDGVDLLMEHRDLIEQIKMKLKNSRTRALPTILEESETPKIAEDLKPIHIDEKFEHCDRREEIHKFYKSYSGKMKKLDILNYQTLHTISFLHLKEPVTLISSYNSAVSAIKSLIFPNFNPGKLRKIYADQTLKSMSQLHKDLECVYVRQVCLSWEILHWQYGKAKRLQEYNSRDYHSYNQVAKEFQQFPVLVQIFIDGILQFDSTQTLLWRQEDELLVAGRGLLFLIFSSQFLSRQTLEIEIACLNYVQEMEFSSVIIHLLMESPTCYQGRPDFYSILSRAMGFLMGKQVTTSYSEVIMAWWRELAQYFEAECQEEKMAEIGALGGNIGEDGTIMIMNKNHSMFGMLGLAGVSQTLAFQSNENKKQMVECNTIPTINVMLQYIAARIHYEKLHSQVAAIHSKIATMNENLVVQSSPSNMKEVLLDGLLRPIIRLSNFWCFTKSLSEWDAEVHSQNIKVRYLHFYPP